MIKYKPFTLTSFCETKVDLFWRPPFWTIMWLGLRRNYAKGKWNTHKSKGRIHELPLLSFLHYST